MSRRLTGSLLLVLALFVTHNSAAAPLDIRGDGWHSWEVEAGSRGRQACCHRWRSGTVETVGCDLDADGGTFISGDCNEVAATIRVYVKLDGGKVRDIQAVSSNCPVRTASEAQDLGRITTADSIDWLRAQVDDRSPVAEDAIAAIAIHPDDAAFTALRDLLETRSASRDLREEALFWMAQTDTPEAWEYFDRLLGQN